jgi:hypothetical protein
VFVLEDEQDPTRILGFYTLSPATLLRDHATRSDRDRLKGMRAIPMGFVGFMGRDDGSPNDQHIGTALVIDAARRLYRSVDFAAWGLLLDAEDGPTNEKLWGWYLAQGFTQADAKNNAQSGVMYAALKKFLRELQ